MMNKHYVLSMLAALLFSSAVVVCQENDVVVQEVAQLTAALQATEKKAVQLEQELAEEVVVVESEVSAE